MLQEPLVLQVLQVPRGLQARLVLRVRLVLQALLAQRVLLVLLVQRGPQVQQLRVRQE